MMHSIIYYHLGDFHHINSNRIKIKRMFITQTEPRQPDGCKLKTGTVTGFRFFND